MITDKRGIIEYVNNSFERISGYSQIEAIGKKSNILKSGKHSNEFYKKLWNTILSGQPYQNEMVNKRKDGSLFFTEKTITPIKNKLGEITHFVSTDKDVSERKRQALALEKINIELQNFAYTAAHDLKAPLRTISTYLQLLKKEISLTEVTEKYINFVTTAAKKLQVLIQDLLVYSRTGYLTKVESEIDSERVLLQVEDFLQSSIDEAQAIITHSPLPKLKIDTTQLSLIFQNLISNSLTYRREIPVKIHISAEKINSEWLFTLQDNGIGIAQDYLEKIFNVFYRLHSDSEYPGTGIGLAICKKIIEAYGGKIWVQSEINVGSIFYFTFPNKVTIPSVV
jgi:PAS domain S-box-containing protein